MTPAPGVTHDSALGRWSIALPGRPPFYTTQREIREARVVVPAVNNARTIVVLWNERDSTGHDFSARAITLDGGATVPVAGPTRYDIPLRFASFTPEWTGVSRPGALPGARPGVIGAGEPTIPPGLRAPRTNEVYIVQFVTQPLQEYRDAIAPAGGTIHHWLAYHSYVVQMSPQARAQVAAMPFVRWVGPLHVAYRIDPGLITPAMAAGMPSNEPATARRYNVMVNRRGLQDKQVVGAAIDLLGGTVDFGVDQFGFLVGATLTEAQLLAATRLNEVAFADIWQPAVECTNIAREISGADYLESATGHSFRGQGVTGEVMDGDFWPTHSAFIRFAPHPPVHGSETFPLPGGGPLQGSTKHGTSTFGIVFGQTPVTIPPSPTEFKGFAPEGQGIFATFHRLNPPQSVPREQHTWDLINPAGPYRALFQSNSWGSADTFYYSTVSAALDDILLRYDLPTIHGQGNNGTDVDPRKSKEQALAKNVISVGGVKHRNTAGRSDDRWAPCDLCDCATDDEACAGLLVPRCLAYYLYDCAPICPACVRGTCPGGDTNHIGGASIGPTKGDGRVKPDLVHFYDAVRAPGANSCTTLSDTSYTDNFTGSSAATPIVAGCAALVLQMWHEEVFAGCGGGHDAFEDRAHSSTVKALLVNTAYQYAIPSSSDIQRGQQGWGMPDLRALYDLKDSLRIVDESVVLLPFQSHSFFVTADPDKPLKATMVYRDPAGNPTSDMSRVNSLDLTVVSPSGTKYYGNGGLMGANWSVSAAESTHDDHNTVENVFIESAEEGEWEIVVSAPELNADGDPATSALDTRFALVVSGVIDGSGFVRTSDWNGDGTIDLADLRAFLGDYSNGNADADRDGLTGPSDVAAFFGRFVEGLRKEGTK